MNRKKYNEAMLSIDAKVVEKAKNIKLLILDVDGVMTDGGVIINKDGSESKQFYAQDGHGLMILKSLNIEYAIITGRYSKAVEFRGNELGFKTIIQNSRDKLADYKKHFSDFYNSNDVCFIGDDIVDISLMKEVGLAVTVPNANYNNVERCSHWITPRSGGKGAVRDVCDLIYFSQK